VDRARLWSIPSTLPGLYGAAVSEATARTVGSWADGLITVNQPADALRRVLAAFREGGGDGKPALLQVHLSWAESEDEALAIAHDQWRSNVFSSGLNWNLELPEQFDVAATYVRPEDMRSSVLVSADPSRHAAELWALVDLGFDGIYLHHVGREQDAFLDTFGAKVVPELR
jgi:alkanesulfonate monooxygenase SsuD/methylene tetrahydromethanopterin reductase-like flavin-dependent oxidoreductase (luciferase family)